MTEDQTAGERPNSGIVTEPGTLEAEFALTVLGALPGVSVQVFDRDLRFLMAAGTSMVGWEPDRLVGRKLDQVVPAESEEELKPRYLAALTGEASAFEYIPPGDRGAFWVEIAPRVDQDGQVIGGTVAVRDITDQHRMTAELRESRQRFESAFDNAPIGMALVSPDGRWLKVNQSVCEITGYAETDLLQMTFQQITHPDDLELDLSLVQQVLAGEIRTYRMDKRYLRANGTEIWIELSVSLVRDEQGEPVHFVSQLADISFRKTAEAHLRALADRDELTGLLNRRGFDQELDRQLARCRRLDETATVLVIDADHLKQLNDTFGHEQGDKALQLIADTLRRELRATDSIARIGGDEFAALMPALDADAAGVLAARIPGSLSETSAEEGQEFAVSVSIGSAEIDSKTPGVAEVLAEADRSMYVAKGRREEGSS